MIILELINNKNKFLDTIKEGWLSAKDTFPDYLPEIDEETKLVNENYIKSISSDLHKQIKSFNRFKLRRRKWGNDSLNLINNILYKEEILGLHHYMNPKEIDAFFDELMEFLRHLREFAPELTFADIGQAIRNYIVYAVFKKLHKEDSGFSLAGFGYSMLYPFTDNYLDNKTLSDEDKKEYNQIIRNKIEGNKVHLSTLHQTKTCDLLQDIEELYPRDQGNAIYSLLLMMLDAQETSLRQQNKDLPLSEDERLNISVYKGGISVLIDRFLVNKEITEEDLFFYLGFGFFLQLADDLQDIKEDSILGHSTLFTIDLQCQKEELVVNKLLNFVHDIMKDFRTVNESFKHFLLLNSYILIFSSVIRSREFFSPDYLNKIENYLPVSCSFFSNLQNNNIENIDVKLQNKYIKVLDELIKQNR